MFIAGVVAVGIMLLASQQFNNIFVGEGEGINYSDKGMVFIRLIVVSMVGLLSYLIAAWILRVREISVAQRVIAQRFNRKVHS
jgi:hypothetical protein